MFEAEKVASESDTVIEAELAAWRLLLSGAEDC